MMFVEEKDNERPICPFCEAKLDTLWSRRVKTFFGKRFVYFCPSCKKVLGITHRKGLIVG